MILCMLSSCPSFLTTFTKILDECVDCTTLGYGISSSYPEVLLALVMIFLIFPELIQNTFVRNTLVYPFLSLCLRFPQIKFVFIFTSIMSSSLLSLVSFFLCLSSFLPLLSFLLFFIHLSPSCLVRHSVLL